MDEWLMHQTYAAGLPRIIEVAFKYGYGRAIVELNNRVYFNHAPVLSPIIRETLQALYLSVCENQYCTVMHTCGLITLGFSLDDVKLLIGERKLPQSLNDRERWESVVRLIPAVANEPGVAPRLFEIIEKICSPEEAEEIQAVVAFAGLHRFLLEAYPDEIVIEEEPLVDKSIDCGEELIHFIQQHARHARPLVTICSLCKDVKADDGDWVPIEGIFETLHQIPNFSHGVCDRCIPRWRSYAGMEN